MEFMLVLYEDPDRVATDEQHKEAVERVGEYAMGLLGEGVLKGGAPLHPVTEARRIRIRDGERRILDGPFAESKEVIAGYFVIEAPGRFRSAGGLALACNGTLTGPATVESVTIPIARPPASRALLIRLTSTCSSRPTLPATAGSPSVSAADSTMPAWPMP